MTASSINASSIKISNADKLRKVEFSNNGVLDSLTGAPAPKVFFDNLAREISKSRRKFQAISVITVKLGSDENKSKSRRAADNSSNSVKEKSIALSKEGKVLDFEKDLVRINKLIKSNMRSGDFYSRIPEDGFWICLHGDLAEAGKATERLLLKISEYPAHSIDPMRIKCSNHEWEDSLDTHALIHEIDLAYFS
jgi:GGDEF domain-containing protein